MKLVPYSTLHEAAMPSAAPLTVREYTQPSIVD
jgi:hypothetical protein